MQLHWDVMAQVVNITNIPVLFFNLDLLVGILLPYLNGILLGQQHTQVGGAQMDFIRGLQES